MMLNFRTRSHSAQNSSGWQMCSYDANGVQISIIKGVNTVCLFQEPFIGNYVKCLKLFPAAGCVDFIKDMPFCKPAFQYLSFNIHSLFPRLWQLMFVCLPTSDRPFPPMCKFLSSEIEFYKIIFLCLHFIINLILIFLVIILCYIFLWAPSQVYFPSSFMTTNHFYCLLLVIICAFGSWPESCFLCYVMLCYCICYYVFPSDVYILFFDWSIPSF